MNAAWIYITRQTAQAFAKILLDLRVRTRAYHSMIMIVSLSIYTSSLGTYTTVQHTTQGASGKHNDTGNPSPSLVKNHRSKQHPRARAGEIATTTVNDNCCSVAIFEQPIKNSFPNMPHLVTSCVKTRGRATSPHARKDLDQHPPRPSPACTKSEREHDKLPLMYPPNANFSCRPMPRQHGTEDARATDPNKIITSITQQCAVRERRAMPEADRARRGW